MKIHRNMTNLEIADLLNSVSAAYEIKDVKTNRFRMIAYDRAATAVEHLSSEVKDVWDEGKLTEIGGIGASIASHLDEIFSKGKSEHFSSLMKDLPPAMFEMMKISGVGAKTAFKLARLLNINKAGDAIKILEQKALKGEVAKLDGFGKDSQDMIIKSIKEMKGRKIRMLLPYAQSISNEVIKWLKNDKNILEAKSLGSLRRKASTIGDIDIAISSKHPQNALDRFTSYPKTKRVIKKGKHTASILLPGEIQVDALVQEPDSYGAALQHFTGSKHHNIALREYAIKLGLSLSEHGIRKNGSNKLNKFKSEKDFYKFLKLEYIPPELREDMGEIEAAKDKQIPKLIQIKDVNADLHMHSDFDIETSHDLGLSSMREIINKANELNYEYIAFTEHNPSRSKHKDDQIIAILRKKSKKVEEINNSLSKTNGNRVKRVFNSLEIDIMPDGNLSIPDGAFEYLDFGLISIHSSFNQSKDKMTKRIINAMKNKKVKIFAHPTARVLNSREGIEIDWKEIFKFCIDNNKWLEINAGPTRLDLPDFLVKDAKANNVKLTLGTDSHHIDHMDNMKWGVSVARRGWVTKNDIINTRQLSEFEKLIEF